MGVNEILDTITESNMSLPAQINIVGPDEILRHCYDCGIQLRFAMMIRTVLRNITGKLCDFYFRSQLTLKCCE